MTILDDYIKHLLELRKQYGGDTQIKIIMRNPQGRLQLLDYDLDRIEVSPIVLQKSASGAMIVDYAKPYDSSPKFLKKFKRIVTKKFMIKI